MDRKFVVAVNAPGYVVALRKESVDRKGLADNGGLLGTGSLSARRAWIEKFVRQSTLYCRLVALRKESVDRKTVTLPTGIQNAMSLSARRAWIEKPVRSKSAVRPASLSARRAWIEKPALWLAIPQT